MKMFDYLCIDNQGFMQLNFAATVFNIGVPTMVGIKKIFVKFKPLKQLLCCFYIEFFYNFKK